MTNFQVKGPTKGGGPKIKLTGWCYSAESNKVSKGFNNKASVRISEEMAVEVISAMKEMAKTEAEIAAVDNVVRTVEDDEYGTQYNVYMSAWSRSLPETLIADNYYDFTVTPKFTDDNKNEGAKFIFLNYNKAKKVTGVPSPEENAAPSLNSSSPSLKSASSDTSSSEELFS